MVRQSLSLSPSHATTILEAASSAVDQAVQSFSDEMLLDAAHWVGYSSALLSLVPQDTTHAREKTLALAVKLSAVKQALDIG